ncbi:MAG: PfkB family carbohydrate kinase, partial [Deltaproteobacteria bacterium]|nr:PfkB family carbohydrate kinase [Deltaproteobacteria bacterium]
MRGNAPETLKKLAGSLVLCLGDLMLDRFIYGTATRLSPEAPVPVVAVRRRCCMPGGLGNVVMNLAALGARPLAVGLTGRDRHAQVLSELLAPALDPLSPPLLEDPDRPTTVKTRIIAGIQQVARLDEESEEPLPADLDRLYRQAAEALLPLAGATVASDYGKGVLSPDFCAWLMARAKELNSPVVVDPKGPDYSRYAGAWLVTPNRQELSQAVGRDLSRGSTEDLAAAGRELMARHRLSNVLITRSED